MPQRLGACWHQTSARVRVSRREQGDLMPASDKLLSQDVDDAFGAAVRHRWNTLQRWRQLGDPHASSSLSVEVADTGQSGVLPVKGTCGWCRNRASELP